MRMPWSESFSCLTRSSEYPPANDGFFGRIVYQSTRTLIQKAGAAVEALLQECPDFRPLLSIRNQLANLADYIAGTADRARLRDIDIGLVAAREIEGWDDDLAHILHLFPAEARSLQITSASPDH